MDVSYPNKNFQEMFNQAPKAFLRFIIPGIFILVLLWLASGFYVVGPGEVGVIRRFGEEVRRTEAGLRYHFPGPMERVDVVTWRGCAAPR